MPRPAKSHEQSSCHETAPEPQSEGTSGQAETCCVVGSLDQGAGSPCAALRLGEDGSLSDEALGKLFRALSHPARLTILRHVRAHPSASCGDIVKSLPLAQSTVSQHLLALKEAGLLTCEAKGRCCHYSANLDTLRLCSDGAEGFFGLLLEEAVDGTATGQGASADQFTNNNGQVAGSRQS